MSSGSPPLVSVVTPVYDGETTIGQCIESVLVQTYPNLEYVIVNNCSRDRTGELLRSYAEKDSRVKVYENDRFVTAAENHHIAFRKMSPESRYCKIVQADDWIFPDCLEHMVALAEKHPSVGIVGSYRLHDTLVTPSGLAYPSTVIPGREICRRTLLGETHPFGGPTSLLIRTTIVRERDPFYNEVDFPWHSDLAVCYEILQRWDFGFVHRLLTFTRYAGAVRTGAARRLVSSPAEGLLMFQRYGPLFLEPAEYRKCLKDRVRRYYWTLGSFVFRRPGSEFWDFHREWLKKLGLPGGWLRLLRAAVSAALRELSSPLRKFARAVGGPE